jgi:hypothetical protein
MYKFNNFCTGSPLLKSNTKLIEIRHGMHHFYYSLSVAALYRKKVKRLKILIYY